ncbi:MAG: TldD/PmbA family protein [Elusimicrobiota bacterium]
MIDFNFFKNIFTKLQKKVGITTEVELFGDITDNTTIVWSEGKLEDCYNTVSQGIGLRIIKNSRTGFAYTNNFSDSVIDDLVLLAEQNRELMPEDEYNTIASPTKINTELDISDETFRKIPIDKKINILKNMERFALSNKKIRSIAKAGYSESSGETYIVNSNRVAYISRGTFFSYGISCVASDGSEGRGKEGECGEIQVGGESTIKRIFNDIDFETTTSQAVRNAVDLLGAKRIKTGSYPVIFNQNVGCDFLGLFSASFSAFAVQKNVSLLKERINQKVCSEKLSIIDDGTLTNGVATSSFDDDGIPTQKTIIIENGVLKNYIHNLYTAKKDNTKSTGNASRGYSGLSVPEATNLYIQQSETILDSLLKKMGRGLYITETMGMHNADAVSGEFSVGVNGFYVENGEKKFPVHGVTIAGNILDLFDNILDIGNDLKFYGSIGSPSLLINQLSVAGE